MSAEAAVLGAALLSADACDEALASLTTDDFESERHRIIFTAMKRLQATGEPVTPDTVRLFVDAEAIGGAHYLLDLTDAVTSTRAASSLIRSLADQSTRRRIIAASVDLRARAESGEDVSDLLAMVERMTETRSDTSAIAVSDIVTSMLPEMTQPREYYRLGDWGVRLRAGSVTIVGARPAVGKSAFALQEACGLGERHVKTRIYSYEMSNEEWAERAVARVSGFTAEDIDAGLADYRIEDVKRQIDADWARFVDVLDCIGWQPHRVFADMRRFARKGGKVAFVDYLQLMTKQSYDDVTEVSRMLKVTARQTGLAVVALSQLSRKPAADGKLRPPSMSDLRQSGALEQDADNVVLLHDFDADGLDEEIRKALRDKGYHVDDPADLGKRLGMVSVAKTRRGPKHKTPAWFDGAEQRWVSVNQTLDGRRV